MVEDVLCDRFVLRSAFRELEFRADDLQEPEVREQPERFRGPRGLEDLHDLLLDPLAGEAPREGGRVADRQGSPLVDRESEPRREADGPKHAQGVFGEPLARLTDRTHHPRLEVALAAERIDELARFPGGARLPGHRVHREVASRKVFVERVRERYRGGVAMVGVVRLDAVRRDLDVVIALPNHDSPEAVQVEGVPENFLDLVRGGARCDIPVVRIDAAQRVTDASANDEGVVAGGDEARDDPLDVGGHLDVRHCHGHSRSLESAVGHIPRYARWTSGEERSSLPVPV